MRNFCTRLETIFSAVHSMDLMSVANTKNKKKIPGNQLSELRCPGFLGCPHSRGSMVLPFRLDVPSPREKAFSIRSDIFLAIFRAFRNFILISRERIFTRFFRYLLRGPGYIGGKLTNDWLRINIYDGSSCRWLWVLPSSPSWERGGLDAVTSLYKAATGPVLRLGPSKCGETSYFDDV